MWCVYSKVKVVKVKDKVSISSLFRVIFNFVRERVAFKAELSYLTPFLVCKCRDVLWFTITLGMLGTAYP